MNTPTTPQPHNLTSARPAQLARVVDSSTGAFMPGTALVAAGGEMLFGPTGPGLSYVPYLAATGEKQNARSKSGQFVAVTRYADALHFRRFFTPEEDAQRKARKELADQEAWNSRVRDPRAAYEADKDKTPRGVIRGFSDDSRRRMSRTCATVRDLEKASFVTLTLSDDIVERFWRKWDAKPDAEYMADYLRARKKALQKRAARFWSREGRLVGFIWKLEYQRRKSGRYEGYLVPHLHLVLSGLGDVSVTRQRRWLKAAWWHICGEASDGHERAGVQLDKVYSRAGAGVYVSKYVAKRPEDAEDAELEVGRRWGIEGTIDTSGEDVTVITLAQYVQIRRYIARWLQGRWKGGRRYARTIRRPRGVLDALFIFGAGFQSSVGGELINYLVRAVEEV